MKYRAVALCMIKRDGHYLLAEHYDEVMGLTLYRPVGGTIEYGEDSRKTVIREVKEEIDADISEPKLVAVIENIYSYDDEIGHDINFIYEADIIDKAYYERELIKGIEGEESYNAIWIELSSIKNDASKKLVPDGLMKILTEEHDSKLSEVIHYRST